MRQSQYLIAAKYLQEARAAGFPTGRQDEGNYLLGRALIESGDNAAGLEVLERALEATDNDHTDLHLTLASAYTLADPPAYEQALTHIDTALESAELTGQARVDTLLNRINLLTLLARFNEARATLQAIPQDQISANQVLLTTGQIDIEELRRQLGTQHLDDAEFALAIDQKIARIRFELI